MSKKNIKPNSGKQLYINKIFSRGMLYTSSEMPEGYAKIINNYDIAPTGDAASPRYPLKMADILLDNSKYVYPIKFKQNDKFTYIQFNSTVTEEDFVNNSNVPSSDSYPKSIKIIDRDRNGFNNNVPIFDQNESSYMCYGETPQVDPERQALIDDYKSKVDLQTVANQAPPVYIYSKYNGVSITQSLININVSKDLTGLQSLDRSNIEVIDGDTFKIGNIRYRLYGIDCPEVSHIGSTTINNEKWSLYAKKVLEDLLSLDSIPNKGSLYYIEKSVDIYGRRVIVLYNEMQLGSGYGADVAETLLRLGVAVPRFFNEDDTSFVETYKEYNNDAIENERKLYSTEDFDPYYLITTDLSKLSFDYSSGNNLKLAADQLVQAVKISEQDYQISAKTTLGIDYINCIYLDNLDAIGFIGRVIDPIKGIVYKGLLLLKCNLVDDDIIYTILLPSNQGNGVTPDITSAITAGELNLLNDNMINVKDRFESTYPFSIIGLLPLSYDTEEDHPINPPRVLNKTIVGSTIFLRAILYQNGYYSYNEVTATDNWGFEAKVKISCPGLWQVRANTKPIIIYKSLNEFSNVSSYAVSVSSYLKEYLLLSDSEIEAIVSTFGDDKTLKDITWTDITNAYDMSIYIDNFDIIKDDTTRINIDIGDTPSIITENGKRLWNDCFLEAASKYETDTDYTYTYGDTINISIWNNFASVQKVLVVTSGSPTIEFGNRDTKPKLEFYSQWYAATYGSDRFTAIGDSTKLYNYTNGNLTKVNPNAWHDETDEEYWQPGDLVYTLDNSNNYTFKFSVQPRIPLDIGGDSSSCPTELQNEYYINSFQEMYQTIPILSISDTEEYISSDKLKEGMDIKNATRLDVFNRQVCLYGPYTKSNVLFFSKFEKPDYYPFPAYAIELDEPIIWVYNYKDSLVVFGKYNLYMLYGSTSVLECKLVKIYENLSVHLQDVRTICTSGNNLIFFNNGCGYVISPNNYVDNYSNIKVYKLTESINNFFYNPEEYIRYVFNSIDKDANLSFNMSLVSYIQNNEIHIVDNISFFYDDSQRYLTTEFIYNLDYKYWRMYSTQLFDSIIAPYICEPNLNNQFVVSKEGNMYIACYSNIQGSIYKDIYYVYNSQQTQEIPITTILNTGYLSVDTMNDKRFKDIIIEFDNIKADAVLKLDCDFFIDGSPMLLDTDDILVIDKGVDNSDLDIDKELTQYEEFYIHHLSTDSDAISRPFGKGFIINNEKLTITGRTHVRIPVYGKGRLPLFTMRIESDKFYEFINYSLIYKEKNINRRS